jgi:hypothetical protein
LRLNFPNIAQGDYFQSQVTYTQGATRYMDQLLPGNVLKPANGTALLPANNDLVCATGAAGGAAPCANIRNMNNLAVTLRMHKDFLP